MILLGVIFTVSISMLAAVARQRRGTEQRQFALHPDFFARSSVRIHLHLQRFRVIHVVTAVITAIGETGMTTLNTEENGFGYGGRITAPAEGSSIDTVQIAGICESIHDVRAAIQFFKSCISV